MSRDARLDDLRQPNQSRKARFARGEPTEPGYRTIVGVQRFDAPPPTGRRARPGRKPAG